MKISIVVAVADNNAIGKENRLLVVVKFIVRLYLL
jgi:hypothetical protein